ncbi:MAG: 2-oxoacid:acceptor oxidoreductase family protein [Candidatus Pacebacteria bacterium]|jgi:pyruvate ferredoxin oxidoreductase gamma subunit|nr:2-oxoacid:acceptor oxidoreductase family protein [Candidatus Paceibacterota bacterium]
MIENIYQIRIHSRGGQGAKTAGIITAKAFIAVGKFAQTFAEYGPERSGAPMKTFVRLSDKEIRLHGDVEGPDMVVVMDATLLSSVDVAAGIKKGGTLLVNTPKTEKEISFLISGKNCKIYTIDASGISKEILGKNLPNTVMVGAIAKIHSKISYKEVMNQLQKKFGVKLTQEMIDKNLEALQRGYDEIEER